MAGKEDDKTSHDEESKSEIESQDTRNSNDESSFDELIPDEILETLPIEDRGKVISIMKQSMFSGVMGRGNPVSEKITEEHITKLIDKSDSHDKRDREERKSLRNYNLIYLLVGLGFLAFLIIFLKEDKELLYKIIIAIISFIGGFGIGRTNIGAKDD